MDQTCKQSYNEILEILKYIPSQEYERIPKDRIDFYERHKDPSYKFEYNPSKSLNEQNVLRETKAIIVGLYRDVVATDIQKEKLERILVRNQNEYYKKSMNEKFDYKELFDKKQENLKNDEVKIAEGSTQIQVYRENIIVRMFKAIKRLFSKKS